MGNLWSFSSEPNKVKPCIGKLSFILAFVDESTPQSCLFKIFVNNCLSYIAYKYLPSFTQSWLKAFQNVVHIFKLCLYFFFPKKKYSGHSTKNFAYQENIFLNYSRNIKHVINPACYIINC